MKLNSYLFFNGQCKDAFRFYEKCLGGKIEFMQTFGESPVSEQMPGDLNDWVMHTMLSVDGCQLMGSDAPPPYEEEPGAYSINISCEDIAEGERVFNALAEGGKVKMPFEEAFWVERFGMLTDRFGVSWMVNAGGAKSL